MDNGSSYFENFAKEASAQDFKVSLASLNPKIGDFKGNTEKILFIIDKSLKNDVSLLIFPELSISGYFMRDLFLDPKFLEKSEDSLREICRKVPKELTVILGAARASSNPEGKLLVNSACIIQDHKIIFEVEKTLLANNDVFYEPRYFEPSEKTCVFPFKGRRIGILICEDIWNTDNYKITPLDTLHQQGADLFISINASPFYEGKAEIRRNLVRKITKKYKTPLIYVNMLGGCDELIFDGDRFLITSDGLLKESSIFEEKVLDFYIESIDQNSKKFQPLKTSRWDILHKALVLGIRDFVHKSHFKKIHLGLSGGIDSSLVAKLATDALGPDNVVGLLMPSLYSSESSLTDAHNLASRLHIKTQTLPISPILKSFKEVINPNFSSENLVEENLQARIRGTLLMAYSNANESMLLTTGNKSEISVGYSTLYGDMCGALNPIGDIYKTDIFGLCSYLNQTCECFPESILTKAPSAELKPNQKDEDSLPPYPILDTLLKNIIEKKVYWKDLIKEPEISFNLVQKVKNMINRSEFKRFQSPPILKISSLSFGSGRLYPLAREYFESN